MSNEELRLFWSYRVIKTWVVRLSNRKGDNPEHIIVRALTSGGAVRTARSNSLKYRKGVCSSSTRYAHPVSDLKCTPTTGDYAKPFLSDLTDEGIKHYYPHVLKSPASTEDRA